MKADGANRMGGFFLSYNKGQIVSKGSRLLVFVGIMKKFFFYMFYINFSKKLHNYTASYNLNG